VIGVRHVGLSARDPAGLAILRFGFIDTRWQADVGCALRSAPPTQEPHFRQSASDTSTEQERCTFTTGPHFRVPAYVLTPAARKRRPR
jgi:hypothetical protein